VHVPYRNSKLTRILQESLGGNSRTTLVINCSPSSYNEMETLSTLRFGTRAKRIQNRAKINAELSPAELRRRLEAALRDVILWRSVAFSLYTEVLEWRSGASVPTDRCLQLDPALWEQLRTDHAAGLLPTMLPGGAAPAAPATPAEPVTPPRRAATPLGEESTPRIDVDESALASVDREPMDEEQDATEAKPESDIALVEEMIAEARRDQTGPSRAVRLWTSRGLTCPHGRGGMGDRCAPRRR